MGLTVKSSRSSTKPASRPCCRSFARPYSGARRATSVPITVYCPTCGMTAKGPDAAAGRVLKCPQCGEPIRMPNRPDGIRSPNTIPTKAEQPAERAAAPDRGNHESNRKSVVRSVLAFEQVDIYTKLAAVAALLGLLVLGASPLFNWVNFASGGVIGLKEDGKIVLGVTLLAIAIWVAVLFKPSWLKAGAIAVQAWGTVAVFWMGALVWKVGSILDSPAVKDNPLAMLFATQISPGAGLYLGLFGGLVVAAALGFVAVRRSLGIRDLWPYFATQGCSVAVGILLAIFSNREAPNRKTPISRGLSPVRTRNQTGHLPKKNGLGVGASKPPSCRKHRNQRRKLRSPNSRRFHRPRKKNDGWTPAAQNPTPVPGCKDVYVAVLTLETEHVDVNDFGKTTSRDKHLVIRVGIFNKSETRKVDYAGWGAVYGGGDNPPELVDNFGNTYPRVHFGLGSRIEGQVRSESIYPGKNLIDLLVFAIPIDKAEYLRLRLPADNLGGRGDVRIQIPRSMFSK